MSSKKSFAADDSILPADPAEVAEFRHRCRRCRDAALQYSSAVEAYAQALHVLDSPGETTDQDRAAFDVASFAHGEMRRRLTDAIFDLFPGYSPAERAEFPRSISPHGVVADEWLYVALPEDPDQDQPERIVEVPLEHVVDLDNMTLATPERAASGRESRPPITPTEEMAVVECARAIGFTEALRRLFPPKRPAAEPATPIEPSPPLPAAPVERVRPPQPLARATLTFNCPETGRGQAYSAGLEVLVLMQDLDEDGPNWSDCPESKQPGWQAHDYGNICIAFRSVGF